MYNEVKDIDVTIDLEYLNELVQTYYTRSLLTAAEREERELMVEE